jgi:hypothetical protein
MTLLATQLFREVRPDFFRVLAGPLARLYVDALDALERETSQRNQGLDRAEALALVEQVVEQHEDLADASDELVAVAASMDDARDAVAPLEEAMTGFRDTPPAIAFMESRESYAGNAAFHLAEALVKTGELARAKSLTESNIVRVESGLAKQPENQELKADMAYCLLQLAGELDPAKPEEAARRQSALDRASAYFNSPAVLAKGFAPDKKTRAKIAALRDAVKTKTDIEQP